MAEKVKDLALQSNPFRQLFAFDTVRTAPVRN
jgi:hypothetical protein